MCACVYVIVCNLIPFCRTHTMNMTTMMIKVSTLLLLAFTAQIVVAQDCPAKCTCSTPRTIRCVFQRMTRVPKVPDDTNVLDVRYNNIVELHPGDFHNLRSLHTLLLNDNHIRHLPSNVFEGATNLRFLYLFKNSLETIEPGAFANLPKLEQLYLHVNHLRKIQPDTFSNLPKLERLYMQNNRLERLPADAFRNIGHMTKLRLDSNALICDCELLWLVKDMKERMEMAAVCQGPSEMRGKRLDNMSPDDFHCSQPIIMEGPEDVEVKLGDTAVFRCRVTGEPQPIVKWMRDSNEVPNDGERYFVKDDGSLVINDVSEDDAGEYECVAHNDMGETKSRGARTLVVISSAPTFLEIPTSQTVQAGTDVVLVCRAEGQPTTRIEWWRDGSRIYPRQRIYIEDDGSSLKIIAAKESDSARYICQARNSHGFAETSADLNIVAGEDNKPPRLVYEPQDMEVELNAIIELPCRAEGHPTPHMSWKKDGTAVEGNRTRVSKWGSLYLYNITAQDTGRYECSAVNEHGRATASALVHVRTRSGGANDGIVLRAFSEATRDVDRAINNTLRQLFDSGARVNPFQLARFPDAVGRQNARPAELFERTLIHIRRMIDEGMIANATDDYHYEEILTNEQVAELERLSGCTFHRRNDECLNLCYHNRYRTMDGKCNNLDNPTWGSSYTGFRRILHPMYENGFSQPIGWDKTKLYYGHPKPAARLVSRSMIATEDITMDETITHMVMQWGQWIDHDFDHALPAVSSESWGGIDCKKTCDNAAPCFPMEVPPGDHRITNRRCMDFFRSSAVCGSGMTSVFLGKLMPREQLNQLTSYLDASQVYGYDDKTANELRDLTSDRGLLREGPTFPGHKALLPYANGQFIDCRRNLTESTINCFLAGDFRVNEQIGLTVMHTIWMREHNRIARRLRLINPHWSGEKLYQETRKIIGAMMQIITYRDWIPRIFGVSSDELLGTYRGYNKNLDASIANVFATAALRFGHSLIQPKLERLDEDLQSIPKGPLHLRDAFFAPWRLVEEGGTDPLLRGMFITPAKLKRPDQNVNNELTEQLFRTAHAVALDLAAMNIQRGRDHAIPPYVDFRKWCNMSDVETFDDLAEEISSFGVREKLRELYGHPGNIDVWVGGILEDQLPNAKVGPLFKCLLSEQFQRMRDGDRFWYEKPGVFREEQLEELRKISLARVLCDNADNITRIQADVFILPGENNNFVSCDELPSLDLRLWSECCEECLVVQGEESNTLTRTRRSALKYSAEANRPGSQDDKVKYFEEMIQDTHEEYAKVHRVMRNLNKRIKEMKHLLEEVKSSS